MGRTQMVYCRLLYMCLYRKHVFYNLLSITMCAVGMAHGRIDGDKIVVLAWRWCNLTWKIWRMDGRTNWYYAMCGKNNMWGLQYVKKAMIASVSSFLYMCFWLCVVDKANNSLLYVHVSCDKRLFYCLTWCFVQQRAAVVFIGRHSNTCTNFRVTNVWWLFDVHMDGKNDGNLPSKNVRNGRIDELLCVVKIMAELAVVCR